MVDCSGLSNTPTFYVIMLFACDYGTIPCDVAKNFKSCIFLTSPCGWCSRQNKCTKSNECEGAGLSLNWATLKDVPMRPTAPPPTLPSSCDGYNSCTDCIMSPFPCHWCLDNHKCTDNPGQGNCPGRDTIIESLTMDKRKGPKFCPVIKSIDSTNEILVPSGGTKALRVRVSHVDEFMTQIRYRCCYIIWFPRCVPGKLLGDTIYCDDYTFDFWYNFGDKVKVGLEVRWANKTLANPDDVHVLTYWCERMGKTCDECMHLEDKYGCGWCKSSGKCEPKHNRSKCDDFLYHVQYCEKQ